MIALLKSHYSIGRSIIQDENVKVGEANQPDQPTTVPDILKATGWKKLFVCEDSTAGFYPLYNIAKKNNTGLCFGWRVTVVENGNLKEFQPGGKVNIWVKSEAAWKALIKLATKAQIDFFFEEPRLDWNSLHEGWHPDLILCIPFYDSFLHKNLTTKYQSIPDFRELKPYIFLEDNDLFFDGIIRDAAIKYAKSFGLETVETKTCYYGERKDLVFFQGRKLMDRKSFGSGGTIQEPNMEFFSSAEFCVEAALENPPNDSTSFEKEFDEPLNLFLPGIRLPEFILEEDDREEYAIPTGASDIEILRILARKGYQEKIKSGAIDKSRAAEYGERVNYELDVLEKTYFYPYILLVWNFIRYALKNNLAIGPGRGSACGSLVCYLVGMTKIDPIPHGLYFERFISAARAESQTINGVTYLSGNLCDFDCDMGTEARDKVIEYLSNKYKGRFSKLSTYNTQTTKALVKDAGKVLGGFSEDQMKTVSDEVPVKFGKVAKPEKACEESPKFKKFADDNPLVYNCVKKLHGCIKNFSSHASSYVVSYDPLEEIFPLQYGTDNEIVTSCDAHVSEKLVIKLDLLGLQSITLFDRVAKAVGVDPEKVDYNDYDTIYKYIQKLECPSNLFQISGDAAVRGSNKIMPKSWKDLSAVLAICRPGSFVFLDQYADYVNGKGEKPSLHPLFDDILEETAGVCLYQETLMRLYTKVGFTLAESDNIRRICGKKLVDEVAEWEGKIYKKCEENGIPKEAAEKLWSLSLMAADYSFNKSLSRDTIIQTKTGSRKIEDIRIGEEILAFDISTKLDHYVKVLDVDVHDAILWDYTLTSGIKIRCSKDHKFLTRELKMVSMEEIINNKLCIISDSGVEFVKNSKMIGYEEAWDLEVDCEDHNFYANKLVTSNSHSISYSRLTALSVFLKFNFPQHFFLESLRLTKEKQDPSHEISQIVQELPSFNIKLLPPSLTKSSRDFTIHGDNLLYGLESIKGISDKSIAAIIQFIDRDKTNLFQVFQAAKQSKVNSAVFGALVQVGVLDDLSAFDRQKTLFMSKIWGEMTEKERNYCLEKGAEYNYDLIKMLKHYLEWVGSNGKPIGKESRLETLRKNTENHLAIYRENIKNPMISQYLFEKKLLGYCPSITLSELFKEYPDLSKIAQIKTELYEGERLQVVAEVREVKTGVAKKSQQKYARVDLSDETGNMTCLFTGDKWLNYVNKFGEPEEGQIIYIVGSKGKGEDFVIFGDRGEPQMLQIFSRVNDLKKYQEKHGITAEAVDVENIA